jgi:hypothetical protein
MVTGKKILEIVWLITSILGLIAGVHKSIKFGISQSYGFFIIAIICFGMYYFRHTMNKNPNNF